MPMGPQMMYQNQWDLGGNANLNYQAPMSQVMGGTGMVDESLDFRPPQPVVEGEEEKKTKRTTRPNSREFAKKWTVRLVKAEDNQKTWAREGKFNYGLYYNKPKPWARAITIKGYTNPLVMFTNPVALNVDIDCDRMLPKNPSFKVWPKVRYTYFPNPNDPQGPPAKRDNVVSSRMYQEVANMLALELDLRKTIKRAIKDSLVTNLGAVKIAWDEIGQLSHSSPHVEGENSRILGGGEVEVGPNNELARPHFPWCVYVPWDQLVLDPTAGSLDQVNWIAEKIRVPKAELDSSNLPRGKDNNSDTITKMKNVAAGEEDEEDDGYALRDDDDYTPDIEMVEYWEVHYREVDPEDPNGFCYYTFDLFEADGGAVRNHRKYDRDIGGFCYEFLQFKEINGDLLGYSQVRLYASPAAHANLTKQIQLDYAIRALPFLLADGGLDKKVLDGIANGTVAKMVKANGIAKDKIIPIQMSPLSQDLAAAIGLSDRSADQMSGRSVNDRLQSGVDTATEAKVIAANSQELTLATIDVLRIFAARVIKKCVRVFASLLDANQTYQVPDRKGGFFQFEQQNLCCDIAIELDWQSTVRKDDAVERKLMMDLMTIAVNAKMSGVIPNVNVEPLFKRIAILSGIEDVNEILIPQEMNPFEPSHEHMLILAGTPVEPDPSEDLAKNYKEHLEFAAMCDGDDQQLTMLWRSIPGALQRLMDHITRTRQLMEASGMAMEGGSLPGSGGGSGARHNRPSEGMPNAADMQAVVTRGGGNPGGSGMKMGGM